MPGITETQYREMIGAKSGPLPQDEALSGSAGDREHGKFRYGPGGMPRLTAVAVVGNDGQEIGTALVPYFGDLVYEIRQLRLALTLSEVAQDLGDFA